MSQNIFGSLCTMRQRMSQRTQHANRANPAFRIAENKGQNHSIAARTRSAGLAASCAIFRDLMSDLFHADGRVEFIGGRA